MMSNTKNILLLLGIITLFSEIELLHSQDALFLQQQLINFLFPKDPSLVKVRRMEHAKGIDDVVVLDFVGMVEQYGYPAEEHNVTTEDGYNLIIHRISGSPLWNNREKKEVVFIQHGIFASSDSWVLFGPGKDLAFLLADQGYDVWVGNIRGNSYGRSHVKLTTYDRKFWQFSFHEVGIKDMPTMIDYVLKYTGEKNLLYIAHSMGTTTLFVLLSMRPEYNAKIKTAICLAPIAFWTEITPSFKQIINIGPRATEFAEKYKIYDVAPQSSTTITLGKMFCNDRVVTQAICATIFFLVVGSDPTQLNTTALPYLLSYFPAGASIQTLFHFYQNIIMNDFRCYDYGIVDNYKRYNQKKPSSYELRKITVPIALFYGANDMIATKKNVYELSKRLPNVVLIEEVPFKLFNHADFLWAIDAKTFVYDRVIKIIEDFGYNHDNI